MTSSSGDAGRFWQRLTTRFGSRYSRGSLRGSDTTADAFYGQHGPNTTWPQTTPNHDDYAHDVDDDVLDDYDEVQQLADDLSADAGHAGMNADHSAQYGNLSTSWAQTRQEWADAAALKPGLSPDMTEKVATWEADRGRAITGSELRWLQHLHDQAHDQAHEAAHDQATTDITYTTDADAADDVEQAEYEQWINSTTSRDSDAAHGQALAMDQLANAGLPLDGAWAYRGDETAAELHRRDEDAAATDARTWERFDDLSDALEAEGLPLATIQYYDGEETAIGLYLADGYADHIADPTHPWPHAGDVPEHLAYDDSDMPALHAAAQANAEAHQALLDAAEGQEYEEADEL